MSAPQTARTVLDRHYLEIRARILEVAACLDRIDRADADGSIAADPRMDLLRKGIDILATEGVDRAERIQILFSDPYDPDWKTK